MSAPHPFRHCSRGCGWLLLALAAVGCSNRPAWLATAPQPVLAPTGAAGAPLPVTPAAIPLPSYSDPGLAAARAAEERSRAEARLLQDEVAALREQLASTSTQLAQARAAARPVSPEQTVAGAAAAPPPPPVLAEALARLAVPQATVRLDGGVIRIDIPADRLFESGTAGLLPGGATILTEAATEIERVCPGHFIGIEGHTDNQPLPAGARGSPHQLASARASAVFDFLTERTALTAGQLFMVAHGPNHPLVSNATAAGRTRNRRIELVIYPERAPSRDAVAAATL